VKSRKGKASRMQDVVFAGRKVPRAQWGGRGGGGGKSNSTDWENALCEKMEEGSPGK